MSNQYLKANPCRPGEHLRERIMQGLEFNRAGVWRHLLPAPVL